MTPQGHGWVVPGWDPRTRTQVILAVVPVADTGTWTTGVIQPLGAAWVPEMVAGASTLDAALAALAERVDADGLHVATPIPLPSALDDEVGNVSAVQRILDAASANTGRVLRARFDGEHIVTVTLAPLPGLPGRATLTALAAGTIESTEVVVPCPTHTRQELLTVTREPGTETLLCVTNQPHVESCAHLRATEARVMVDVGSANVELVNVGYGLLAVQAP